MTTGLGLTNKGKAMTDREPTVTVMFTAAEYDNIRSAVKAVYLRDGKEWPSVNARRCSSGLPAVVMPALCTPALIAFVCEEWSETNSDNQNKRIESAVDAYREKERYTSQDCSDAEIIAKICEDWSETNK